MHNLLFCVHTLCLNYVANTFLLVSSSVRSKQLLCFVHGQAKKENKNIQQRTLTSFTTFPSINYAGTSTEVTIFEFELNFSLLT